MADLPWGRKKCRAFQTYIEVLKVHMRLQDWEIYLGQEEADEDVYACVDCTEGKQEASIRVRADYWKWTPEHQRLTLVHELLHVHHRRSIDHFGAIIATAVPSQDAFDVAWEACRLETEIMVDQLSRVIAPTMPFQQPR